MVAAIMGIAAAIGLAIDNIDLLKEKFYQFVGWAQELWTTVKSWFGFGDENAKNIETATKNLKPIEPSLTLSPAAIAKSNIINRYKTQHL